VALVSLLFGAYRLQLVALDTPIWLVLIWVPEVDVLPPDPELLVILGPRPQSAVVGHLLELAYCGVIRLIIELGVRVGRQCGGALRYQPWRRRPRAQT